MKTDQIINYDRKMFTQIVIEDKTAYPGLQSAFDITPTIVNQNG